MINLTRDVIFLKKGGQLKKELLHTLRKIHKAEKSYCNQFYGDGTNAYYREKQFTEKCDPKNLRKNFSAKKFIGTLNDAVCAGPKRDQSNLSKYMRKVSSFYGSAGSPPVTYYSPLRRAFARVLMELWSKKSILLPLYFPAQIYIPIYKGKYHEINGGCFYEFYIKKYNREATSNKRVKTKSGQIKTSTEQQRLSDTISFILASDWHSTRDVSLDDIADAQAAVKAAKRSEKGTITNVPRTRTVSGRFIAEIKKKFGGEIKIKDDELSTYSYWSQRSLWNVDYRFREFYEKKEALIEAHNKKIETARIICDKKYQDSTQEKILEKYKAGSMLLREAISSMHTTYTVKGRTKVSDSLCASHEALELFKSDKTLRDALPKSETFYMMLGKTDLVEEYYLNYGPVTRNDEWMESPYPGREHIDIEPFSRQWKKLYEAWIVDRLINEGFEDLKSPRRAMAILGDYLFLYLPFWIETHPETSITVPSSPKELDRHTFIDRDYYEPNHTLPCTLYDLLSRRYKNSDATLNGAFLSVKSFFKFLHKKRRTFKDLIGNKWQNPIEETDKFKTGGRRKTPKVAFEDDAAPWILRYFYALNDYGLYLQKLAFEQGYFNTLSHVPGIKKDVVINPARLSRYRMINTEKEFCGFVPTIKGEDSNGELREIRLTEIPNVYLFSSQMLDLPDGTTKVIIIPHVSACRANITMYETGRRNCSARHLDRRTWDDLNIDSGDEELIYDLNVNTDKVQNPGQIEPAQMLKRLRDLLKQEDEFQDMLGKHEPHNVIKYLGRDFTRFDEILPLFRSATSDNPLSDAIVRKVFKWMIYGVQETLNKNNVSDHSYIWATYNKDTNEVKTPKKTNTHSFRANFITKRYAFFPDDVNILVSQANMHVSGHYYRPSRKDMKKRFLAADKKIHGFGLEKAEGDAALTISFDESVHLHPSSPESALRKSWEKDPDETIRRFHFMMINMQPQELDKESQRGLEILRVSPANQLKWFDTHVCPVNMQCPNNIVQRLGASHRCGVCPIAGRCVDHIPAIRAERRSIGVRIVAANKLISKLKKEKAPIAQIRQVQESKQMDAIEFSGWQASEKYLLKALEIADGAKDVWHIQMPEIVRLHLQLVVPPSSEKSYFLERVAAVQAYPALVQKDTALEAQAKVMALKMAKDPSELENVLAALEDESIDAINLVASQFKVLMKAKGVSPLQIYENLQKNDLFALEEKKIIALKASTNNEEVIESN